MRLINMVENPNDRPPNFRGDNGKLYLVRCFVCEPNGGKENWSMAVATGRCEWCGWEEAKTK